MDANRRKAMQGMVKQALSNLEKNGFRAVYVNDRDELMKLIASMIPEGSVTASGGSETLEETGVLAWLKEMTDYRSDRKEAYGAAYYLASANALTVHGEIYEVDARSNRVSAMLFGPDNVIVIAGINKLVPNLRAAVERVKNIATPANCIRLAKDTPCAKLGHCISPDCSDIHFGAAGCLSHDRLCANQVIFSHQMVKDRITVVIIGEEYGY